MAVPLMQRAPPHPLSALGELTALLGVGSSAAEASLRPLHGDGSGVVRSSSPQQSPARGSEGLTKRPPQQKERNSNGEGAYLDAVAGARGRSGARCNGREARSGDGARLAAGTGRNSGPSTVVRGRAVARPSVRASIATLRFLRRFGD